MVRENEIRAGETAIQWPGTYDASRVFIGRIHKPWTNRMDCPRRGGGAVRSSASKCSSLGPQALAGIENYGSIEVLYWLHRSRRDILPQSLRPDATTRGRARRCGPTQSGTQRVTLAGVEGPVLSARGLDYLDARR
jgi:tRNA (Thr-GGU) A37 N-methylase